MPSTDLSPNYAGPILVRITQAISRLQLTQGVTNNLLLTSLLLNIALSGAGRLPAAIWYAAAAFFGLQTARSPPRYSRKSACNGTPTPVRLATCRVPAKVTMLLDSAARRQRSAGV